MVYSFCAKMQPCPDGVGPNGALATNAGGDIFGVTFDGGSGGMGVVWRLAPKGSGFNHSTLWKFDGTHGRTPVSGPVVDTNGDLYGVAPDGGAFDKGTVYELMRKPDGHYVPQTLYDFCPQQGCADGAVPFGLMTYQGQETGALYDGSSPLYGTTDEGGATGSGTVFELTRGGKGSKRVETVLYNLCSLQGCTDGGSTDSGLIIDPTATCSASPRRAGTERMPVLFSNSRPAANTSSPNPFSTHSA